MGPKSYTSSTAPTVDDHVQAQPERSCRECLTNGYVEQYGTYIGAFSPRAGQYRNHRRRPSPATVVTIKLSVTGG